MPFGEAAGSFATAFSQAYQGGLERKRLNEVMQLEREQMGFNQNLATRQMDLQERGAAREDEQFRVLQEHQEWQKQFQAKQLLLQQQEHDLTVTKTFMDVLDSTTNPKMRQLKLKQMGSLVGIDPKSEQFKEIAGVIGEMDVDAMAEWQNIVATVLPGLPPGQAAALVQGLLTQKISIDQIIQMAQEPETGPLESIIGPDGKPVLATRADAVGKTPAPSSPQVSIDQRAEGAEAVGFAGLGVDEAKRIVEDANSARGLQRWAKTYKQAAASEGFTSGPFAGTRRFVGELLSFAGGDPELGGILRGNDPVTADVMENASLKMAEGIAAQMSRLTNMSLQFVLDQVPELSKTPQGNAVIADMVETTASRQIALEKALRPYIEAKTLTPEGQPSFYEVRDRLLEDWSEEDDELETRMRSIGDKGRGINWDAVPGVGKAVGDAVSGAASALTVGTIKQFRDTATNAIVDFKWDGRNWIRVE